MNVVDFEVKLIRLKMLTYHVYVQALKALLWLLLNACFKGGQWLLWKVTGVNEVIWRASLTPWFEQAAQVSLKFED